MAPITTNRQTVTRGANLRVNLNQQLTVLTQLLINVCISLCIIEFHNTAENSSVSLPSHPPDNCHSSDIVHWVLTITLLTITIKCTDPNNHVTASPFHTWLFDTSFWNCYSCRPSISFNSSVITKSLAKYSSEHELVEFGIALPVLVTETLSMAVGELLIAFDLILCMT